MKSNFKSPAYLLLLLSSFALGLFNELACVAAGAVALVLWLSGVFRKKEIKLQISLALVAVTAIVLGYLVTALWAVDNYYSVLGFAKFLPLLGFFLLAESTEAEERQGLLSFVPLSGVIMTIISFIFTKADVLKDYFSVNGRISGFFQYSNTFALFLIIGIIVLIFKEKSNAVDYASLAVLVLGVFLTGSRSSFALMLVAVAAALIASGNKRLDIAAGGVIAAGVVAAVCYSLITKSYGAFGRFLTTSISAGTLQGRILYFKDAIRVIAKHPFGLGYMGYYFSQGSFQTGVYSNQYVHNELLQLMLDIGWLPAILFVGAVVKSLFSKKTTKMQKLVLASICVHSMLDFDFQFLVIAFVAVLCLDFSGRELSIKAKPAVKGVLCALAVVTVAASAYLSTSSLLYTLGNSSAAARLCPSNTMAQIALLENDDSDKREIAEQIIKNNKYISNAYSTLASYHYQNGDVLEMIEAKKKAISCNRYFIDEYVDYCGALFSLINYYSEAGDYESAEFCCNELAELEGILNEVREQTDDIAYKLTDKPQLDLPEEYQQAISELV